jgi:3-carboxy-cis,cis-muconate cycloisomerase
LPDHERSTGPWEIEWIVLPEAFCLTAGALRQTRFVLEGLEVDAGKMRANLDLTNGLVMSEAVMMGLGPYIGRESAHDLVYDICREAIRLDRPLIDLLAEHPEIKPHLGRTNWRNSAIPPTIWAKPASWSIVSLRRLREQASGRRKAKA